LTVLVQNKAKEAVFAALPADTKIIPGHGPPAGIGDLKAFR